MREIKFRAWDTFTKEMQRVEKISFVEWLVTCKETERNSFSNHHTDRHILMQFTGHKDKNGVDIYEGDIVQTGWQGSVKGVVVFEGSTYCVDSRNGYMYFNHPESYEVIGNIWEREEMNNLTNNLTNNLNNLTAIAKYIVQEDELRNKKFKYKVPKFLCDGSLIYLCRDIIDEYFFISYGKFSDEVFQSFFTDEEIEKLIEEYGEDFKTFIEMCEKVEVE